MNKGTKGQRIRGGKDLGFSDALLEAVQQETSFGA